MYRSHLGFRIWSARFANFDANSLVSKEPFNRFCSTASAAPSVNAQNEESTEKKLNRLAEIENAFANAVPSFKKRFLLKILPFLARDMYFEDKVRGRKISRSGLTWFLFKVRMYLSYRSSYNHFETVGTAIRFDENIVSLIWRLDSNKSTLRNYFQSPLLIKKGLNALNETISEIQSEKPMDGKERIMMEKKVQEMMRVPRTKGLEIEECVDIHVNEGGRVDRIVNRKADKSDYELAEKRAVVLAAELEEELRKQREKEEEERQKQLQTEKKEGSAFEQYK